MSLRNQGRADTDGWLDHSCLGFNYRLGDIPPRSASSSSRSWTRYWRCAPPVAARYARLLDGVDGV